MTPRTLGIVYGRQEWAVVRRGAREEGKKGGQLVVIAFEAVGLHARESGEANSFEAVAIAILNFVIKFKIIRRWRKNIS